MFCRLDGCSPLRHYLAFQGLGPLAVALLLVAWTASTVRSECVANETNAKRVIGATAVITEASSGLSFPARVDTGAASCSLHVEQIEIDDESPKRLENVGKRIRFLLKDDDGQEEWVETTIAGAVRIRSSVFKDGQFDRRYKVPLVLQWNDFRKEVLVTLTERTDMKFPLLLGRNFLHGDFLVDVSKNGPE